MGQLAYVMSLVAVANVGVIVGTPWPLITYIIGTIVGVAIHMSYGDENE